MYFEVSGVTVEPWIPPLVAFIVSMFASLGGISGAFILLPFQVSVLGYLNPSVSATNHLYNVVAIPGGVYKFAKEGRMVWPLTWIVVFGTLPGVLIGSLVRIIYLPDPAVFKIFAGIVLAYIGVKLISDLLNKSKKIAMDSAEKKFHEIVTKWKSKDSIELEHLPRTKVIKFNASNLIYEFYGERFTVPTMKIFLLSLIIGIVGGAYGIGGGAILAPIFVSYFGLPIYTVTGATLMGTFVTSVAGVSFFLILAPFFPKLAIAPDFLLGLLFGIGGLAGIYVGSTLQKFIPAIYIKWMLGGIILLLAIKYIFLG